MECAGKGCGSRCTGPVTRRCGLCGAVSYCSVSHQVLHWNYHKEECERLGIQMSRVDDLNDFPFTFTEEATVQVHENKESMCLFLSKRGVHCVGLWIYECNCGNSIFSERSKDDDWRLLSSLCPCDGPLSPIPKQLLSWKDYYDWRCIPLHSPVALLLHWPLTIYYATQVIGTRHFRPEVNNELRIHYLGPEKELHELAVFAELQALFPGLHVHVEIVGPAVPQNRDGERIELCSYPKCIEADCTCKSPSDSFSSKTDSGSTSRVTLCLRKGFYHDRYKDIAEDSELPDSPPHLVIAPNAGIAAYASWIPTIELIREMNIRAVFTDYCEEACHLAATCLNSITGVPLSVPIQLNPFRQPMTADTSLFLPCYSNCFIFGM